MADVRNSEGFPFVHAVILGRLAYETFCAHTPLPLLPWDALPETDKHAWIHVGTAVKRYIYAAAAHAPTAEEQQTIDAYRQQMSGAG